MLFAAPGLGQTYSNLDHNLISWSSKLAVPMVFVDSKSEVNTYATDGFHVSVIRGSVGGCADPALGWASGGTNPSAVCKSPLGDEAAKAAWDAAAGAYLEAFQSIAGGATWRDGKALLATANKLADEAYAADSAAASAASGSTVTISPPRYVDKSTGETVTDGAVGGETRKPRNWTALALGGTGLAALAGILGYVAIGGYYKGEDKGSKSAGQMMGRARRRRARR